MHDYEGPWRDEPGGGPPNRPSRTRVLVWIAVLVAGAIALVLLARAFPGAGGENDDVFLVRNIAILALLSSGIVYARRMRFSEFLRNLAIWTAIAAVLVIGYSYQDELKSVGMRVRSELMPSYAVEDEGGKVVVVTETASGDYRIRGEINGRPVVFLVDTGASDIVLSPADARRIGIDTLALSYDQRYETANGEGVGAFVVVDSLTVGKITLAHVRVSVTSTEMGASLLGMSFLRRLKSFEFRGRRLYLRS